MLQFEEGFYEYSFDASPEQPSATIYKFSARGSLFETVLYMGVSYFLEVFYDELLAD